MDSSNADGALFRESSARMNKALNDVARERDDALKALAESRARFADSEARRAELEATAEYLAEAIRLTQEYVGPEILPPIEGWSWYDALAKYRSLPRSVVLEDRDRENRAIGWDEGHTHCFHVENPKNEGNPYRGENQ